MMYLRNLFDVFCAPGLGVRISMCLIIFSENYIL